MLPGALSDSLRTQLCPLRGTVCLLISLTCYSSRAAVQVHTMQLAITQMESTNLMPHNTINNQARDLRLKLLQCIGIARHHRLTPRDFTNSTSCFYFLEITPTTQASRLLPSSHLSNCPWIRSQSLSIANHSGREKLAIRLSKCSLSSYLYCLLLITFLSKISQTTANLRLFKTNTPSFFLFYLLSYLSSFPTVTGFLVKLSSSSQSSPKLLPSILHQ